MVDPFAILVHGSAESSALCCHRDDPTVFAQLDHNPWLQNNDIVCFLSLSVDGGVELASSYKWFSGLTAELADCHANLNATCNDLNLWGISYWNF